VVSFHDPVIDGANMEDTDLYEWQRRPGFSIFCPIPMADSEIVNQFYSSRNLNGQVSAFVDTNHRLATFTDTSLTTIIPKTTIAQGYINTIGNMTYYSDGAPADLYAWDGTNLSIWGLAAPTITPTVNGLGFWQPFTTFSLGDSILDTNGNVETVTAILIPNGAFEFPTAASTLALGGSLALTWTYDPIHGGYAVQEGYSHIQQNASATASTTGTITLPSAVTVGNVLVITFGILTTNVIPSAISVTDDLGNVYSQQAMHTGVYAGGGGNNYYSTEWVWTTPVTVGGVPTISVVLSNPAFEITAHEFSGISATATTSASNFVVHPTSFDTGTVAFSGTQLVFSTSFLVGSFAGSAPAGYTPGASITALGTDTLANAYYGAVTSASPTWSFSGSGEAVGLTVVFPLTTLATGWTPYLFLQSFNNAVPTGATVVGIEVTIPQWNVGLGAVQDHSVKLVIGGSVSGSDVAASTVWSQAGYTFATYGGPTNVAGIWGITPTAAQLNANGPSGFGVAISALISSIVGGSVVPEVGFDFPNQPTVTIYYTLASGQSGPGITGANEPVWPTNVGNNVVDGGLTWTNYGNIQTWYPVTGYPTPVVILDPNGNLQLSTYIANPVPAWDVATPYAVGEVVSFGGQYWISLVAGNTGITPSAAYAATGSSLIVPYWALTTTPLVTGVIPPVWNTTDGGLTVDGSYTWTNLGQGTGLAFTGYEYVYAYRTIYDHLTTASPFSPNTGAILGPLNGSITSFKIVAGTPNIVTFYGSNNFAIGNVFTVRGLTTGTSVNNLSFTVTSAVPSSIFPLTSVEVTGGAVLIIQAINNLVAGQTVTFSGVGTATWLNGLTVTVSATGLSTTQFESTGFVAHVAYGPTGDIGTVNANGNWTAVTTLGAVSLALDSGVAIPLMATITGVGTGSPLCNSIATITAVSITANVVTITASNNFQDGLWVTLAGMTGATFLNGQQFQVIAVDQPVGTQNTWFHIYFENANYVQTVETGTATFNAVEIYRTSDGGGTYLFDGAVTNPGAGVVWTYDDFVIDADLDILLVAPLYHQNDPPPGGPGSSLFKSISIYNAGTILAYWGGRLWMVNGNYVYFNAGPDCTNGRPEQAWPPGNRFQFAGPVLGIEPTADGVGLMVFLADRVNAILGGPETISFYPTDFLSNFGISNPNAIFRDGSIVGLFTTQRQYFELVGTQKLEIGEHISDYLTTNFTAIKTYATTHRNGLDVGTFVSNGVDQVLRYGSNVPAWSVPAFPACGAGALRSVETSVGFNSLMLASPTGGITSTLGPANPLSGTSVGTGAAWVNPNNITAGNPALYAVATFAAAGTSQTLRAAYPFGTTPLTLIPLTAVVQGVQVTVIGKQSEISGDLTLTIKPTGAGMGSTSHTFSLGLANTTVTFGGVLDTWGMTWGSPTAFNAGALGFDITSTFTGLSGTPNVDIAEVQVTVTYQNPGNYLYARDTNSWGDCGVYGANNGTPYSLCNVVIGSITLSQLGAPLIALQHVVGYFNAVGTLQNGGSSQPNIWLLPNEVNDTQGVGFVQLPEVLQEPPVGQNHPSKSLLALRWPINMVNSFDMSQYIHHLQVRIQFEPENAPNTIKAIAFKESQD
jgi:hypothetical protein